MAGFQEQEVMYKLGPAGSEGIEQWDFKGRTQIVQIFISYQKCINSIQFQYVENQRLLLSPIFGNPDYSASGFDAIKLDYPSEYITGIVGTYTSSCIAKLTIYTNKSYYGSFGDKNYDKEEFSFRFGPENQFGGFHGSHDSVFLTSIGVYFKPLNALVSTNTSNNKRHFRRGRSEEDQHFSDEGLADEDYIDA